MSSLAATKADNFYYPPNLGEKSKIIKKVTTYFLIYPIYFNSLNELHHKFLKR